MEVGNFKIKDAYLIQMPLILVNSRRIPKIELSSRYMWIEQGIHISVGTFGGYSCVNMKHKIGTLEYDLFAGLDWYETARSLGVEFQEFERSFCEQLIITAIHSFPKLLFMLFNAHRDAGYVQGDQDSKTRIKLALGL